MDKRIVLQKLERGGESGHMRKEEQERIEGEAHYKEKDQRGKKYELLGGAWTEDLDAAVQNGSISQLERYRYFKGTQIKNSMIIPYKAYEEGDKLLEQGQIEIKRVMSGFDYYSSRILGKIDAVGRSGNKEFELRAVFSRTEMVGFECGCEKCRASYNYAWFTKRTDCPYKAGLLQYLEDYLNHHNLGDATDQNALFLLSAYKEKRANQMEAGITNKAESLTLLPRLIRKGGKLSVSFKVGEKKLFVVKKLDVFCRNVRKSATDTYGSNTLINHSPSNFTNKGRKWIHFIDQIVREEEEFQQRIKEAWYYYDNRKKGVGSELNLFGWRLDEFYKLLSDETVEYDNKDDWEKKKQVLSCAKRNPKVTMTISAGNLEEDRNFHGIKVEGNLPDLYMGTDAAYYISADNLFQVDKAFLERIEPLVNLAAENKFSFLVGRNNMSEFYYRVLPQLQDIVKITEKEPEKIHSYLLPEEHFVFYLDAENQNITCGVYAVYGKKEMNVLDNISKQPDGIEPFRNMDDEEEVLYQAMKFFPEIDWKREELHCGGEEELVYEVMEHGTQKLMDLGEVRCTQRFRGYHSVKPVKVSVGVSVSSGLLELDIATEDIPQSELLDILSSYRAKKKYYRLKDGAFVNLQDSSLEMLSELMDTAHVKPKEFVKGKMHLPLYRTLYLDKMLEEHESVYSNRDSCFKAVIKGFKTVKDADFEEPESLSKIMRKYQKNGYKWLRTLETWQFGGILADEMGLGKTLQVIAVLLAAKQEGKEGTSLVIAPASLVFNWEEELKRFAPELTVAVIAGTQEARWEAIDGYRDYDILVTSYDLLKRDIVHYEDKEFFYQIIDEAQYIKNHTTAASKAVKIINSHIRYALTGTPIENRLSELWSIFDYLMPGFLYGYDVFKRELESPIVKNEDEAAMKRLQRMVGPFILRRLKKDVLKDLPEKLEECHYVQFEETQQKLYDGQVLHMRESLVRQDDADFNKNKLLILAELTRLRQICCDPSLCFENYTGQAAKLQACIELVKSAIDGGHRMLVFSQFTSMLDILEKNLEKEGISYYTITGSTPKEKRLQMVREFNEGDTPVFLISLKAGGVGLNLTGADVVIHYDPWWNLAVQNQATDRAHRIGQTNKVTVYKLIVKNTIEEKIQKLQETKKDLAEQIIGGETGQLGSLSRDEILELLNT